VKKVILNILIGMAIATAFFMPVLIHERRNQYTIGHNAGKIDGLLEAARAPENEFGRYDGHAKYRRLFGVKTTDVISVDTNGTRTVRIIP
jgi:hypothetical protein